MGRSHKYNAKKTMVDGFTFDSLAEAARYCELCLLQQAGEISDLELQPKFVLLDKFTDFEGKRRRGISYHADFRYVEVKNGQIVVEDVKGKETEGFKLKLKLFLVKYDSELRENLFTYVIVKSKDVNKAILRR
jgi:hypothetical protein